MNYYGRSNFSMTGSLGQKGFTNSIPDSFPESSRTPLPLVGCRDYHGATNDCHFNLGNKTGKGKGNVIRNSLSGGFRKVITHLGNGTVSVSGFLVRANPNTSKGSCNSNSRLQEICGGMVLLIDFRINLRNWTESPRNKRDRMSAGQAGHVHGMVAIQM